MRPLGYCVYLLFVCVGCLCVLAVCVYWLFVCVFCCYVWAVRSVGYSMFKAHGGGVAPAVLQTFTPLKEEAVTCVWRQMIVNC